MSCLWQSAQVAIIIIIIKSIKIIRLESSSTVKVIPCLLLTPDGLIMFSTSQSPRHYKVMTKTIMMITLTLPVTSTVTTIVMMKI